MLHKLFLGGKFAELKAKGGELGSEHIIGRDYPCNCIGPLSWSSAFSSPELGSTLDI
jgi:hypothetical protein